MNAVDALARYLECAARRLRFYVALRGAAILAVAALILTILLAWVLARVALSPASLLWTRIGLTAGICIAAAWAVALPIIRVNIAAAARALERRFPSFAQRLLTFVDSRKSNAPDPFLPFLAESTLEIANHAPPAQLIPKRSFAAVSTTGLAAALALFALILWGPTNIAAIWTGTDIFRIEMTAPRKTIRRGGSMTVTARVIGFNAHNANLWIRHAGSKNWISSPMLPSTDNAFFGLQLPDVARNIEYYAESQGVRSPVSRLRVVDLPSVTGIRVTYPDHPALARATNGDIVAPAGTIASLEIQTDRPMDAAQLTLEENDPVGLPPTVGNRTSARLRVLRDDGYHVGVKYDGEYIPVSGEHAIEVLTNFETTQPKVPRLLYGSRVGPVPPGYEKSVAEYYRRLSERQNARR